MASIPYNVKLSNYKITSCPVNKYISDNNNLLLLSDLTKVGVSQAKFLNNIHGIHHSAWSLIIVGINYSERQYLTSQSNDADILVQDYYRQQPGA